MVVKDPYYGKSNFVYECVQGDSVKEVSKNYLLSIKEKNK